MLISVQAMARVDTQIMATQRRAVDLINDVCVYTHSKKRDRVLQHCANLIQPLMFNVNSLGLNMTTDKAQVLNIRS